MILADNGTSGWEFLMWMVILAWFIVLIWWYYQGAIDRDNARQDKESRQQLIKELNNHANDDNH